MGIEKFKQWMKESSTRDKEELANYAGVSKQHIYDIAAGRRKASFGVAVKIAFGITSITSLQKVSIEDLYPKLHELQDLIKE